MRILGYDYELDLDKTVQELKGNAGYWSGDYQLLQIAKDLTPDGKLSAMLHEILEAVNYHLELKLEHGQICSIESSIYQVLKDGGVDLTPLLNNKSTTE